jgi:hypothetical protein
VRRLYLDLFAWIQLTRARLERPGTERHRRVYGALRTAVGSERVVVPLSSMHYMELLNVTDPAQRAEVALTMDEISNYVTLTPREVLIGDELRRSMARVFDRAYEASPPPALGHGAGHAFGRPGRMAIRGPEDKLREWAARTSAETVRATEELAGCGWRYKAAPTGDPLERVQDAIARATEFQTLRGPDDADLPRVRELGYDPGPAAAILENIRKREEELARHLKTEPIGPARLAKYISARAWVWDLGDDWNAALADVGLGDMTIEQVGRERIHAIVAGVPIVVVESAVRQGRFRNGQYRWERNDIFDIGFIGHAVVCCDAVLTDKDVRRHVVDHGVDTRFGTTMLRGLDGVLEWLGSLSRDAWP